MVLNVFVVWFELDLWRYNISLGSTRIYRTIYLFFHSYQTIIFILFFEQLHHFSLWFCCFFSLIFGNPKLYTRRQGTDIICSLVFVTFVTKTWIAYPSVYLKNLLRNWFSTIRRKGLRVFVDHELDSQLFHWEVGSSSLVTFDISFLDWLQTLNFIKTSKIMCLLYLICRIAT